MIPCRSFLAHPQNAGGWAMFCWFWDPFLSPQGLSFPHGGAVPHWVVGSWNFGQKGAVVCVFSGLTPSIPQLCFSFVPATLVIPLLGNHTNRGPRCRVTLLKWKCGWAPENGTCRRDFCILKCCLWWDWKTREGIFGPWVWGGWAQMGVMGIVET